MKNVFLAAFIVCFCSSFVFASNCCSQPVRNAVRSVVSAPVNVGKTLVVRSKVRRETRQNNRHARNSVCSCSPCSCN